MHRSQGSDVLGTKRALVIIVFVQYIPRFVRFVPLTSELKKTAGTFAETAWAGAAYYLLWFLLASHVSSWIKTQNTLILYFEIEMLLQNTSDFAMFLF